MVRIQPLLCTVTTHTHAHTHTLPDCRCLWVIPITVKSHKTLNKCPSLHEAFSHRDELYTYSTQTCKKMLIVEYKAGLLQYILMSCHARTLETCHRNWHLAHTQTRVHTQTQSLSVSPSHARAHTQYSLQAIILCDCGVSAYWMRFFPLDAGLSLFL